MNLLKNLVPLIVTFFWAPLYFIVATSWAAAIGLRKRRQNPALVWGSTPIINNSYWARAMKSSGFISETYTFDFYSSINKREDWDRLVSEEFSWALHPLKPYLGFLSALWSYDIFFLSFDGFFLGNTPFRFMQSFWFRLAGKKVVVMPYGSDSYVYRTIRSTGLIHGLMMSYPKAALNQDIIQKQVSYWTKNADVLFSGIMGPDGFGRWDVLAPTILYIDLDQWKPSTRKSKADGVNGAVQIVHAPNHRGFKGSEFILEAIKKLQAEGLKIELILLEKLQNSRVKEILNQEADILVEQLIATGHGMNGLEGLASGIPVISNMEDESYMLPLRRWSYLDECPLVSGTPETLVDVLRKLITNPDLRNQLGDAGRKYVEKYHGLDSARFVFGEIIEFLQGNRESLINLFHPLLGQYPNRSPKVVHPLVKNRIVD